MTNPDKMRLITQFPKCPHCGDEIIVPASDAPICVQVSGRPPQTISRSEAAAVLRFLTSNAPNGVVTQQIYEALGKSINVSRAIDTLRKRLGKSSILCEDRQKRNGPGTFGVFYLPDHVRVWEPEGEG